MMLASSSSSYYRASSSFSSSSSSFVQQQQQQQNSNICKIRVKPNTNNFLRIESSRNGSGVMIMMKNRIDGSNNNNEHKYVLTAAHVASMAGTRNELECTFPKNDVSGEVSFSCMVSSIHETLDLALLRVTNNNTNNLPDGLELPPSLTTNNNNNDNNNKIVCHAYGFPMLYADILHSMKTIMTMAIKRNKISLEKQQFLSSKGEILNQYQSFIAHTAKVSSGCSGGPLIIRNENDNNENENLLVVGIHSFGDKFYGGSFDIAVQCTEEDLKNMLDNPAKSHKEWATNTVNAKIMKSSLKAMKVLFPEMREDEAKKWIL